MEDSKAVKKKKKTKTKWVKKRHSIITAIVTPLFFVCSKLMYGLQFKRLKKSERRQFLIVSNHQTAFDQFFIGLTFGGAVYYVASEDMFSTGWLSRLLTWAVAPIPFKKSTNDVGAVMNCMRAAHEGGTICIFPEGNRTYHGKTVNMKDSIAVLAKKMKLPLALYRIEGGYGVQPRWSDVKRRGKMKAGILKVIEPEELARMSEAEIYDLICRELYIDEHATGGEFKSGKLAESLERAIYVCPKCGLSRFVSQKKVMTCEKCGQQIEYLPDKTLRGVGCAFDLKDEGEWYEYQENYIRKLDLSQYYDTPAYEEEVTFLRVIPYKYKEVLEKKAHIRLYGNRYEILGEDVKTFRFEDIQASSAVGKNKLNFYVGNDIYQIKADRHFNALKYVNFYYHYIGKGDNGNAEFLGL